MTSPPQIKTFTTRFFPSQVESGRLVVVLHGLGDSLEGFLWMPRTLAIPEANYLLVNAPHPYVIGFAWYDIENPWPGVLHGRAMLQALLEELGAQGWAGRDVLLFGFSQGCVMATDVALRHPEPLLGVVGISGYALLTDETEGEIHPAARQRPWLVTHGHLDPLLPLERTKAQFERLRAAGIPIEWHEFAKEHTIDLEDELPLLREWIRARVTGG